MSMKISIEDVEQIDPCMWKAQLAPDAIRHLGNSSNKKGQFSVVLVDHPEFRPAYHELRVSMDKVLVLNVGQGDQTIFISSNNQVDDLVSTTRPGQAVALGRENRQEKSQRIVGAGDKAFLRALDEVPEEVRNAGIEILYQVRQEFSGDLRPYPRRRFFETPDNFWGVEIQVRLQKLKFTVRGKPEVFEPSQLDVWLDRPPVYSAFRVASRKDVAGAVRIIQRADRK